MEANDQFAAASRCGTQMKAVVPHVVAARFDERSRRIVLHLSSKLIVSFSPADAEGLEHARPSELKAIEISPSGLGIHFPQIDADIYVPALLEGFMGSRRWMAARLGQAGGKASTRAKKAAARANGKLGGRPRKLAKRS